MRLAINSGGLDSFFNGISSFVNLGVNSINSNRLIDSFQTVANKTSDINGGVGTLGAALGYIKTCKVAEETRRTAVQAVKTKTDNFIQTALRVDAEVAATVNASKEEFYKTNPWLRPPAPPSNWDKFWGGVVDTAKKCWGSLVKWYDTSGAKEVLNIVGTIVLVSIVAVCTFIPPLTVVGLVLGSLALACVIADGALDVSNEVQAFSKKREALDAEKNGDYVKTQQLRNEANALSEEDTWAQKWFNDGETNALDGLGALMIGIQVADAAHGFSRMFKSLKMRPTKGVSLNDISNNAKKYESTGWLEKGFWKSGNWERGTPKMFKNSDDILPKKLLYTEHDAHRFLNIPGIGRGTNRFIHGSNGSIYFSATHYGETLNIVGKDIKKKDIGIKIGRKLFSQVFGFSKITNNSGKLINIEKYKFSITKNIGDIAKYFVELYRGNK